ncbi:MAG: hypothetical protein ABI402_02975 [Ferruginibacter sp.]
MPNTRTNTAASLQVNESANVKPTTAAKIFLTDFSSNQISQALNESHLLDGVNLVDEMFTRFKGAVDYLAGTDFTGRTQFEISNDVFIHFYQPFIFYYELSKMK